MYVDLNKKILFHVSPLSYMNSRLMVSSCRKASYGNVTLVELLFSKVPKEFVRQASI